MKPTDPEEDVNRGMVIGILLVVHDVKEPLPASYYDVTIMIEEKIVIRYLSDVPNALLDGTAIHAGLSKGLEIHL